jgi:hypothetical protein
MVGGGREALLAVKPLTEEESRRVTMLLFLFICLAGTALSVVRFLMLR